MTTSLAVGPGVLTPGLYLTVDLLAGAGTGTAIELKTLLIAPVNNSVDTDVYPDGDLDIGNDEVRRGSGPESAAKAFGVGSSGHLAAIQIYGQSPGAIVDFLGTPALEGSRAEFPVVLIGVPDVANTIYIDIAGRKFSVVWPAGTDFSLMGQVLADAINQKTADLPVYATIAGDDDQLLIQAKDDGLCGNDVLINFRLDHVAEGGGTEAITILDPNTYYPLEDGAGAPDLGDILYKVETTEYAFIVPVLSNEDIDNDDQGGVFEVRSHIGRFNSGLNAKLQQMIVAQTWDSISSMKSVAVSVDSFANVVYGQLVHCINGRALPGEFAGREVGGWLAALPVDPAVNRIGEQYLEVSGAFDLFANTPTGAQTEDALGGGVSIVSYTAQGIPIIVRPITTHCQDAFGGPDRRCLDAQFVSATYIVARDLRSALPAQFPNAKITPDIEIGQDPPPRGVIEERDIKGFIITRLRKWQNNGVITKASLDASIADGTLSVKVNSDDATQVDIFLPFKIVPPLAKFGVVVNRVPS